MKIISNKKKLLKILKNEKNLGFVPTMGAFHKGHLSLMHKSINQCNKTIVSIFINKPQFNRKSDYKSYPRKIKKDIKILKKIKIDYLFLPTHNQIYPNGVNKKIKVHSFSKKLCGKSRPRHFEAIADVVHKFVKIINPKKIYLGEKDWQQLMIIKHFFKKNNIKTKVISCRTVREKNGTAYSSRNFLLSKKEKIIASEIYKLIHKNKVNLIKNRLNLNNIKKKILNLGATKIDYLTVLNINKIFKPYNKIINYKIFVSYYLGSVRLIDNI